MHRTIQLWTIRCVANEVYSTVSAMFADAAQVAKPAKTAALNLGSQEPLAKLGASEVPQAGSQVSSTGSSKPARRAENRLGAARTGLGFRFWIPAALATPAYSQRFVAENDHVAVYWEVGIERPMGDNAGSTYMRLRWLHECKCK